MKTFAKKIFEFWDIFTEISVTKKEKLKKNYHLGKETLIEILHYLMSEMDKVKKEIELTRNDKQKDRLKKNLKELEDQFRTTEDEIKNYKEKEDN